MKRRRFDHLFVEICVSVGQLVPRYGLWLCLQELGWDPEELPREAALSFCDLHLVGFLTAESLSIDPREQKRLRARLLRYDPRHPTPEETLARIFSPN
ncbi:MAG: hypothetical protein JRH16_20150 [Deltaproteobacteria bacterium]|nr:hypothetical protein [Deltaproteobacteria bacterium]